MNNFCSMYNTKELNQFNIISLPIFSKNPNKLFYDYLIKGKTLFVVDSSRTLMFEEMKSIVEKLTHQKSLNFDFNHNKIKKVNSEKELLSQMGFSKKKHLKIFILKFF